MKYIALCIIVLAATCFSAAKQFRFDYKYLPEAGGWLKLHVVPATWHDASYRCHLEGAWLASPVSPALWSAMTAMMMNGTNRINVPKYHIGTHAHWGDYISMEDVMLASFPKNYQLEQWQFRAREKCLTITSKGHMGSTSCDDIAPYMCFKKELPHTHLNECGTVDMDYHFEPRTNSCYKFHTVPRPWHQARMICAGEGGHLAVINSEEESQILVNMFAQHPADLIKNTSLPNDAAIGFYCLHGTWVTVTGETLQEAGFSEWGKGQPNTGDLCGGITRKGKLADEFCHKYIAFICEMEPNALQNSTDLDDVAKD